MKGFDLNYKHKTINEIDEIMSKNNFENIVVILCDGMGTNILKKSLTKNDFLLRNLIKNISSVCPATTTAATTSMLSGLNPVEHGWLG